VALPVEFTLEALEDIEDLPRVARTLSVLVEGRGSAQEPWGNAGRAACGQADPLTREVLIDGQRVLYRLEREQIVVLSAELEPPSLH
jgi:hypothetical protein